MISETLIGASIAFIGIFIGATINYYLSIATEKRKLKIQSMVRYKEILTRIKIHIIEIKLGSKGKKRDDSLELMVELHNLIMNFYTFPNTKYLAEELEEIKDFFKEIIIYKEKYDNEKYNDFINKIDELGKKSL